VLLHLHSLLEAGPLLLAHDIETRAGAISCHGMCWGDGNEALCIPFMSEANFAESGNPHYFSAEDEWELALLTKSVLEHPNVRVIGQNYSYDLQHMFRLLAIVPRFHGDTTYLIAAVDPSRPKDLGYSASYLSPWYKYWKGSSISFFEGGFEELLWDYNCMDCWHTLKVWHAALPVAMGFDVLPTLEYLNRLFYPFVAMSLQGLRISRNRWFGMREAAVRELTIAQAELNHIWGGEFSITTDRDISTLTELLLPNSGGDVREQVIGIFFDVPGAKDPEAEAMAALGENIEIIGDKKGSTIQVGRKQAFNEDALTALGLGSSLFQQVLNKFLRAKRLQSLMSKTFSMKLQQRDTEMYLTASMNLVGTLTYRMSMSKDLQGYGGNITTLPRDPIEGVGALRSAIIPPKGYKIFEIDLSRGDLQALARTARESVLLKHLESGYDLYVATGLLHREGVLPPYEELCEGHEVYPSRKKASGAWRFRYKTGCIAINYGAADKRVGAVFEGASQVGAAVRKAYFQIAPEIGAYQEMVKKLVENGSAVYNHYGMSVLLTRRQITNAMAWGPQSLVARYVNEAWWYIVTHFPTWKVVLQFHDSLVLLIPDEEVDAFDPHALEQALLAVKVPASHFCDEFALPFHCSTPDYSWAKFE